MQAAVDPSDALAMADRFRKWVADYFHPRSMLLEVPFAYVNTAGQRVSGFMDLVLETDSGWVVIDHKSFPGAKQHWEERALSHSGQLQCYREALSQSGRTCRGTWIHFMVGGGLLEISSDS